jgi:hypothetical protein
MDLSIIDWRTALIAAVMNLLVGYLWFDARFAAIWKKAVRTEFQHVPIERNRYFVFLLYSIAISVLLAFLYAVKVPLFDYLLYWLAITLLLVSEMIGASADTTIAGVRRESWFFAFSVFATGLIILLL